MLSDPVCQRGAGGAPTDPETEGPGREVPEGDRATSPSDSDTSPVRAGGLASEVTPVADNHRTPSRSTLVYLIDSPSPSTLLFAPSPRSIKELRGARILQGDPTRPPGPREAAETSWWTRGKTVIIIPMLNVDKLNFL